jgi:predicted ribosome quality control (RQC) complex YloA/Tae2 family protein
MHKMNNLEYSFIVKELSQKIVGRHFDRIRKIGESLYRMKIANVEIICELGVRVHETMLIESTDLTDKFVEKIKKELDNAKLLSFGQVNKDRIVEFVFDKGTIVFEMFGEGNAILVKDGVAVTAARYESWSGREIKAGAPYSPPKNVPTDGIVPSEKYIMVSLMKLPIGKEYVAEALNRAKIDEKAPGISLKPEELARLEKEIARISKDAKPVLVKDPASGKPVDISLTRLSRYPANHEVLDQPTWSQAADAYYSAAERPNPKLEKLEKRLEKQLERMVELQEEEKRFREAGDYIYHNYQAVESALALAKSGKFDEMDKGGGKADKKEKSIEVEI